MGVLYGGLGISKLQFLIKKIDIKFQISILGHQTLDPDPGSGSAIRTNAGSGSAKSMRIRNPVFGLNILKFYCVFRSGDRLGGGGGGGADSGISSARSTGTVPWSSAASTAAVPWLSGGDDVIQPHDNAEDWRRDGDTDGGEAAILAAERRQGEGEAAWGVDAVIL